MDIAQTSMTMSQISVQNSVSLSLMKMNLGDSEKLMEGMEEMMDSMSVDPNLGQVIDVTV